MPTAQPHRLLTYVRREQADAISARTCCALADGALAQRRHDDARSYLERALALSTRYASTPARREMLADIADAFERGLGDELQARRIRKLALATRPAARC